MHLMPMAVEQEAKNPTGTSRHLAGQLLEIKIDPWFSLGQHADRNSLVREYDVQTAMPRLSLHAPSVSLHIVAICRSRSFE